MTSKELRAARKRSRKLARMSHEEVIDERRQIEAERDNRHRGHFEKQTGDKA